MLTLILSHLRSLSPSYRAAKLALRIERERLIGHARYLARKSMERAAAVEHAEWTQERYTGRDVYRYTGPGFLPSATWRALPLFGRTFRSL